MRTSHKISQRLTCRCPLHAYKNLPKSGPRGCRNGQDAGSGPSEEVTPQRPWPFRGHQRLFGTKTKCSGPMHDEESKKKSKKFLHTEVENFAGKNQLHGWLPPICGPFSSTLFNDVSWLSPPPPGGNERPPNHGGRG